MLTLFTTCKSNRGPAAIAQRNALMSWSLLPGCETIVFGNDEGIAELAAEVGARHVPEIARNEHGTQLISDLFAQAERLASHDMLAFANADIMLMRDLLEAVQTTRAALPPSDKTRFLIVGRRCNVDLGFPWDYGKPDWDSALHRYAQEHGTRFMPGAIDYFVFPRGMWGQIPPFAVGRPVWDNWMIYRAWELGAPIIDATDAVLAVHQNHQYVFQGQTVQQQTLWTGPEAHRNRELAGLCGKYRFTVHNATYRLTAEGLAPALDEPYLRQRLDCLPAYWPKIEFLARVYLKALRLSEKALPPAWWKALVLASTPLRRRPVL